jgi:type IV pilus assembly protein PilO
VIRPKTPVNTAFKIEALMPTANVDVPPEIAPPPAEAPPAEGTPPAEAPPAGG